MGGSCNGSLNVEESPARKLVDADAGKIVSICNLCGLEIKQLVVDGKDVLDAKEWDHAVICTGKPNLTLASS